MKEIDFENLSLYEYRDKYCKDLSLDVLRRAYGYTKNSNLPQSAVSTAAVIYAEPFKTRELKQHGVTAEKRINTVSVWNLQTETEVGQDELRRGKWDFHNRALCISRLGENYNCCRQTTLEFPYGMVIGLYDHRHRYVAVVGIEPERESALALPKVQEVANILAENALAHYTMYLHEKEYREWACKHPHGREIPPPLPEFKEFMLEQPLRFVEGINQPTLLERTSRVVSLADFINQRSDELQLKLNLATVDLFGDFAHL